MEREFRSSFGEAAEVAPALQNCPKPHKQLWISSGAAGFALEQEFTGTEGSTLPSCLRKVTPTTRSKGWFYCMIHL